MLSKSTSFDCATTSLEKKVTLVEASAGTGKTFAIGMLVLRLIAEYSLCIDEILLVTFTRAATEELADRIRSRLLDARVALAEPGRAVDKPLRDWVNRIVHPDQTRRKIDAALQQIDRASIFTIHGFCQRMLKEQPLESKQFFEFELLPETLSLRREIARDFWRKSVHTLPQRLCSVVLTHFESPEQLLATVSPVPEGQLKIVPEPESLEVSSTELEKSFLDLSLWWGEDGDDFIQLLAEHVEKGHFKKEFTDAFERWSTSLHHYFTGKTDDLPENLAWLEEDAVKQQLNGHKVKGDAKVTLVKNLPLPGSRYHAFNEGCKRLLLNLRGALVQYLTNETETALITTSSLTYDTLVSKLHDALNVRDNTLIDQLRDRYAAALIDEFQDTDYLQWQIFGKLFASGNHYLYLIGDPKQAIYRFRGADIHTYFSARETAEKRVSLAMNFRSHPGVVEEINRLFQRRKQPFIYQEHMLAFEPVEAAPENAEHGIWHDGEPMNQLVYCQLDKSREKENGLWSSTAAQKRIAKYILSEISRLLMGSTSHGSIGNRQPLQPGDIAVLVRKNDQAVEYQNGLRDIGIPAVIASKQSIFTTAECEELYILLRSLADPLSVGLLKHAMTLPWFGRNGDTLHTLWQDEKQFALLHARFMEHGERWRRHGLPVMMRNLIEAEGVYRTISRGVAAERKISNIQHLIELSGQVESEEMFSPEQLVTWLTEKLREGGSENELRLESDAAAVRIITMHGAKGLEYPVVFCPFLWHRLTQRPGAHPHLITRDGEDCILDLGSEQFEERLLQSDCEDRAEEMRLLYVSLTRAKQRCYLFWCDSSGRRPGPSDSFSSALGYLLFDNNGVDFEKQKQVVQEQASGAAADYVLISGETEEIPRKRHATQAGEQLALKRRSAVSSYPGEWRMTSYSALASSTNGIHYQDVNVGMEGEEHLPFSELVQGANFGNLVHDVFEQVPFVQLANRRERCPGVEELLKRYGIVVDHDLFYDLLATAVSTPLVTDENDEAGFCLADVQEDKCAKEMGFYYQLKGGEAQQINSILNGERGYTPIVEREIRGYLSGFIDLVFEHAGQYYIVDYKTNYLGDYPSCYHQERLVGAMASHNYGLQYWIYTLVLHQHLRNHLTGYDFDHHFGGVYYLFLRGVGERGRGIFYHRPDLEKLEELGSCFEGAS